MWLKEIDLKIFLSFFTKHLINLLWITVGFIIFISWSKKIGYEFLFPNGPSFSIEFINWELIALEDKIDK